MRLVDTDQKLVPMNIKGLLDPEGNPTDFDKLSVRNMMTWKDIGAKILPVQDDLTFLYVLLPDGLAVYQEDSTIGGLKKYVDMQEQTDYATWDMSITAAGEEETHYAVVLGAICTDKGQYEFMPPSHDKLMLIGLTISAFV